MIASIMMIILEWWSGDTYDVDSVWSNWVNVITVSSCGENVCNSISNLRYHGSIKFDSHHEKKNYFDALWSYCSAWLTMNYLWWYMLCVASCIGMSYQHGVEIRNFVVGGGLVVLMLKEHPLASIHNKWKIFSSWQRILKTSSWLMRVWAPIGSAVVITVD